MYTYNNVNAHNYIYIHIHKNIMHCMKKMPDADTSVTTLTRLNENMTLIRASKLSPKPHEQIFQTPQTLHNCPSCMEK